MTQKYYARSPIDVKGLLTKDKKYEVLDYHKYCGENYGSFNIIVDDGEYFLGCKIKKCPFIDGLDWKIGRLQS